MSQHLLAVQGATLCLLPLALLKQFKWTNMQIMYNHYWLYLFKLSMLNHFKNSQSSVMYFTGKDMMVVLNTLVTN